MITTLELILIIYIVFSQIMVGIALFFAPRRTKIGNVLFIVSGLLFPIVVIFSLLDDLKKYIERKRLEQ